MRGRRGAHDVVLIGCRLGFFSDAGPENPVEASAFRFLVTFSKVNRSFWQEKVPERKYIEISACLL